MYDPKIVDMMVYTTPKILSGGRSVLATFTLLLRPFRVEDCKLLQAPDGYDVLFPHPSLRINQDGRASAVNVAASEFEVVTGAFAA